VTLSLGGLRPDRRLGACGHRRNTARARAHIIQFEHEFCALLQYLARDVLAWSDIVKVEQVNKRWLGAQHSDFRRCSLSGGESGRPGVVVLTVEPEKAAIVLEALYLVNVLIISRQLPAFGGPADSPWRNWLSSRSIRPPGPGPRCVRTRPSVTSPASSQCTELNPPPRRPLPAADRAA
jgi:hypothetical protein